jgi:uncharacterized membrane protein (DUF373 family)
MGGIGNGYGGQEVSWFSRLKIRQAASASRILMQCSKMTGFLGWAKRELNVNTLMTKVQALTVGSLMVLLMIVVVLSTVHLGVLIAEELWKPPRFLIPVQGLLDVFGYFLLVLIGVELIETLKGYINRDAGHMRIVLEVALIAIARKVITAELNTVSALTLFGVAALIFALGVGIYFERVSSTKA